MAREDDVQSPGARKRPRTSRTGTGPGPMVQGHIGQPYGGPNVPLGPGLTSDDVHGPINLLRINGHQAPGSYGVIPEETQALFDKDPETDALLWFPAPPIDGPTQTARKRFTLLKPPVHSLDYLYERLTRQQEEAEKVAIESVAADAQGPTTASTEVEVVETSSSQKSKTTSKRGKAARKRKAPATARGDALAHSDHDAEQAGSQHATSSMSERLPLSDDAPARLLASLESLTASARKSATAADVTEAFKTFLKKPESFSFDQGRSER